MTFIPYAPPPPVCTGCKHLRVINEPDADNEDTLDAGGTWACDAYPDGIPTDDDFTNALITTGHMTPLPDDHGVLFEPGPFRVM